ncbi:unnamed protein product [Amoebophrya sp. A120]|nr:unnamed protein product [Amoebophrya sp. A120]|eukprot:GSA120T00009685001.1
MGLPPQMQGAIGLASPGVDPWGKMKPPRKSTGSGPDMDQPASALNSFLSPAQIASRAPMDFDTHNVLRGPNNLSTTSEYRIWEVKGTAFDYGGSLIPAHTYNMIDSETGKLIAMKHRQSNTDLSTIPERKFESEEDEMMFLEKILALKKLAVVKILERDMNLCRGFVEHSRDLRRMIERSKVFQYVDTDPIHELKLPEDPRKDVLSPLSKQEPTFLDQSNAAEENTAITGGTVANVVRVARPDQYAPASMRKNQAIRKAKDRAQRGVTQEAVTGINELANAGGMSRPPQNAAELVAWHQQMKREKELREGFTFADGADEQNKPDNFRFGDSKVML